MTRNFYVYALKDPLQKPAKIFYIGKGTGSRSIEHTQKPDNTRKGKHIKEILAAGCQVIVTTLVDHLTEEDALRIELELIACLGTIDNGGVLYNSITPHAIAPKLKSNVVLPDDAVMKAQLGLKLLKDAIISFAEENPQGITNSDCVHYLGLQSDNEGRQQDYLSYSILGLLIKEGALISEKVSNRRRYKKNS
ncbi:GIY-YIG nuclease family protein [Zophobihabitans entericus]|uniref:GIY-YIG nuclease family protein n=1 Tax=Zophobihabitans entericus TaxID=1635327 RepID=A0A6G9IBQ1_9GAMM|nr:GIY-YIG nuclease family protein [Zophobihabitans entericus]QIQ21010.1 GIY-YIG nuclease family protein [Zophobihabitans entericus]